MWANGSVLPEAAMGGGVMEKEKGNMEQEKEKGNNKRTQYRILLSVKRTITASPAMALLYCAVQVLYGILPVAYVMFYARFIDRILLFYAGGAGMGDVLRDAMPVILVTVFQYCGKNLAAYFRLKCNMQVVHVEKLRLMDKCRRLPYADIEDKDFQNLLYSVDQGIGRYIISGLYYGLGCLELMLNILSILWVILQYSWGCALAVAICFLPIVLVSMRRGKEDYAAFEQYQAVERRLNSYEELLTSGKYADERIVYGYAEWVIEKWKEKFDEASDLFLAVRKKTFISVKGASVLIKIILLAVIGLLLYMTVSGLVTVGSCTMLITQILALSVRLTWNMASYLQELFSCRSYMENYSKFYARPDMREKKVNIETVKRIEFKDVSFRYGEGMPYVLEHLFFRMESGHTYALVGENGAGKTTVMKLLLGFYDSYEGSILINGKELREIGNLNQVFSAMFQDYARYEISIRDNIFLDRAAQADQGEKPGMSEGHGVSGKSGKAEISGVPGKPGMSEGRGVSENSGMKETFDGADRDKEILQLMERLQLDLSEEMGGEGLDARIGRLSDKNKDLSGGQWQRLAMIRALVHPGDFFLLDEPTAALDPTAENAVYQNFREMCKGRSALLITHRLGAARLSDQILVLQSGRLTEQGTHEELLAMGGAYARMFEGQKGWYEDENA